MIFVLYCIFDAASIFWDEYTPIFVFTNNIQVTFTMFQKIKCEQAALL